MRLLLAASFLCLATFISAAAEFPTIPPIVQQWVEAQQHMGDIAVDFRLTRSLPTLKEPITADGRFWKQADGQFRWEMGSPPTTVLLFDNKDLHVWDSDKQAWQTLSANDGRMRMWMQFLNSKEMNAEAMTKTFTPTVTDEKPEVVTIALQPKGLIVRKHLKQVDLQIDPRTKYLRQIRILQSDDSSVIMTFGLPHPMAAADKAKLLLPASPKSAP
ncbi:MAG: LolA family protein [Verrucomicrobiaceae bacterium]|nr:LolA family protein [Verrucomicrobiaceae bacterium]